MPALRNYLISLLLSLHIRSYSALISWTMTETMIARHLPRIKNTSKFIVSFCNSNFQLVVMDCWSKDHLIVRDSIVETLIDLNYCSWSQRPIILGSSLWSSVWKLCHAVSARWMRLMTMMMPSYCAGYLWAIAVVAIAINSIAFGSMNRLVSYHNYEGNSQATFHWETKGACGHMEKNSKKFLRRCGVSIGHEPVGSNSYRCSG